MKVFISWSKEPSKTVARALSDWLPTVIQAVEPWMSEEDIPAGSRWNDQISNQLATTRFGIICVTPQNQHEPWVQFEAGALAKAVEASYSKPTDSTKESYVCPYLIGIRKSALTGPLTAFQSMEANFEDTKRLLKSINKALALAGEKPLKDEVLTTSFERAWKQLEDILNALPTQVSKEPERRPEEILAEILETVRDTNRKISDAPSNRYGLPSHFTPALTNDLANMLVWNPSNKTQLPLVMGGHAFKLGGEEEDLNQARLFAAERTFKLEGEEENLKKAIKDMGRHRRHLEISVDVKNPQLAQITLLSPSAFALDEILKSISATATRYGLKMDPE